MGPGNVSNPYDQIPYESTAFPQSHPDRLRLLAGLFGIQAPSVTRCRVLELGCASGGNLIPMAYRLPESSFVGVDLSQKQVETANVFIRALKIENVQIKHASILDVNESWGLFDYVICHGVYSWVEPEVREKIFEICRYNLAPEGVAYVSYNTYPGWHVREMIRHMMLYHAGQFDEPHEQIEQARALLDFLSDSLAETESAYSMLLREELQLVRQAPDYYLFHDHLEEVNTPLYFYQFVRHAARHGLQYLADTEFHTMLPHGLSIEAQQTLEHIGRGQVQREQYLDFLRNRYFRQTLLCHAHHQLNRKLNSDQVRELLIASGAKPLQQAVDLAAETTEAFATATGLRVETREPITKAALLELSQQWPKAVPFEELYRLSKQKLDRSTGDRTADSRSDEQTLASDILWCFVSGLLELHTWQSEFATKAGERPRVSTLNRIQLELDRPIVNHRHESVSLDPVAKELFPFLDGNHDRKALIAVLRNKFDDGSLMLETDVSRFENDQQWEAMLNKILGKALDRLADSALISG